jgi:hypothetical protein
MISTAVRATAGALAIGALTLVGAGAADAATIAPATTPGASATQPWRGDFCDNQRNQWNRDCQRHDTWRWDQHGHRWDHWRYEDRDHRWHQREGGRDR